MFYNRTFFLYHVRLQLVENLMNVKYASSLSFCDEECASLVKEIWKYINGEPPFNLKEVDAVKFLEIDAIYYYPQNFSSTGVLNNSSLGKLRAIILPNDWY